MFIVSLLATLSVLLSNIITVDATMFDRMEARTAAVNN